MRSEKGYGAIKVNGKVQSAHRVSYEAFKGEIPDGLLILHACDNRKCINPDHLSVGTHAENMKDAYQKGRLIQLTPDNGFKSGHIPKNRKLTPAQVIEMRSLRESGTKLQEIADQFGVGTSTVQDVCSKRTYANL